MTGKLGPERAGHSSKVTQWEAETQMPPPPPSGNICLCGEQSSWEGRKEEGVSVSPGEQKGQKGKPPAGPEPTSGFLGVRPAVLSLRLLGVHGDDKELVPGLAAPLRGAVEGVEVSAAAPLGVLGVQGHNATERPRLPSCHQHLPWGPDTAQPLPFSSALLPLLLALALFFPPRRQVGLNYRSFRRKASAAGPLVGRAS